MVDKQVYTSAQAIEASLAYFDGNDLAAKVAVDKYLLRDKQGNFLEKSPEQMIDRIASEFARVESKYKNSVSKKRILESMKNFKYIVPQGSAMFGIGNDHQISSIANCFVVGSPKDSYGGILKTDEEIAQIMKRRGGAGIDISNLRPSGMGVNNAARTSDGITCFMERFSNTTKEVAQGGRRGALMMSIDVRSPDIEKFIDIKRDKKKVTGANISVKVSDEFMKAAIEDKEFELRWPVNASHEDAKIKRTVRAKDIWKRLVQANWEGAEPGLLFWDKFLGNSLSDGYASDGFRTVSTNPCAELPLSEYGSCILMLVNLFSFVKEGKFNFSKFEEEVRLATRLIDDMVDLEIEKVDKIIDKIKADDEDMDIKCRELDLWKKIKETYRKGRRVGLGITALADCFAAQNIKYGSAESLKNAEKIFGAFHESVMMEQVTLAKERGTFPIWNWDKEKDVSYIKILPQSLQDDIKKHGRRNISMTTCSPAGSVSMLTRTSSGVEPIFLRKYVRRKKMTQGDKDRGVKANSVDSDGIEWTSFEVTHPKLIDWLRDNPGKTEKDSPYWGSQSNEIDIKQRIHLQAIMQRYTTHSISSTINFPATATVQEIEEAYIEAWKSGCKGITVYRDGCRDGILIKDEKKAHIQLNQAPHRPEVLECDIHYSNINGNQWVFFVGLLDGMPYDVFGGKKTIIEIPKKYKKGWIKKNGRIKDKNGVSRRSYDLYLGTLEDTEERMIIKDIASSFSADAGSYTRLISMAMRHGVPIKYICEQLMKDGAEVNMFSLERCIARIIKKYIRDGEKAGGACETCGDQLVYKDGCVMCPSCGWSKCS